MNAILQCIDQRTGISAGCKYLASRRIPGKACPCHAWPAAILFTFLVQVITGVVVLMYYTPSVNAAWESVYYLKNHVAGGWLLHAMHHVAGVTKVTIPRLGVCNSGVLSLECAKRQGAKRILLLGFDMRGSHFFGPYTNGLSNTTEAKRRNHLKQYEAWGKANPGI